MRRHAKASTAGSTQRQAGLGHLGALAALCFAVLACAATPALAATVTDRPLLFSFDGTDTTAGKFSNLNALEIDQSTGTVYVIDQGKNVLDKFDAAGIAQPFSATGSSSLSPGFNFNGVSDVAVDNSAANPGRVHVMREFGPIKAFSPAGASLWEIGGLPDVCGLAVDTAGHLWVGDWSNEKARNYANSGSPPAELSSVSMASGERPCRLDVDASGNLYINRFLGGVDKYEGGVKGPTIDATTSHGVVVDQSSAAGHVFTLHGGSFHEYDSAGALTGTFGTDAIGSGMGIAYNSALDRVYIADSSADTVKVFGPEVTGITPDPTIEATTEIGISKAKFSGKVNPQSVPNSYHFEWKHGTGTNWGDAKSSTSQSLPEDSSDHTVSFSASGLSGNTTYQVRLVGTNTDNDLRSFSSADTFTTEQAPAAPAVSIDPPSSVTTTSAQISGAVNPQGDAGTAWRLQTSTAPDCSSGFSDGPVNGLGSEANTPVTVSEELTDLLPAQHYCVRINAANGFGSTTSEVKEFTADPIPPSEVLTAFAAPRTDTSARLNGYVNPENATFTYRFEYSADGGATWTALPDAIGSGGLTQRLVSQELTGLQPSTTYQFRFLAENEAGPASPQGEVKEFTTRTAAEVSPPQRGIELVNNPDKGNQNVFALPTELGYPTLAADGEKAIWSVLAGAPGGYNGTVVAFLAERSVSGWHSRSIAPPPAQQVGGGNLAYRVKAYTPDFSQFIADVENPEPTQATESTRVVLDAQQNQGVLQSYSWEGFFDRPGFMDLTDDASQVFAMNNANKQLEEIGSGIPEIVSLMPDGTPTNCGLFGGPSFIGGSTGATGSKAGAALEWRPGYHMIDRTDGSIAYFEAKPNGECGKPWGLYVRDREADETTLIDPGAEGKDAAFITTSVDGSRGYFVTRSQLDPGDANSHADIYRWDMEAEESSCLTCVVPDASVETGSGDYGKVLMAGDESPIYFESREELVPGQPLSGGTNLYVLDGGTVQFVAASAESFNLDHSELSQDGEVLVFDARAELHLTTDSVESTEVEPPVELYRYDNHGASLECVSCLHGGITTRSTGSDGSIERTHFHLSSDGSTIAFATPQALVPLDVNGGEDVYEWRNGSVGLVTDGVTEYPAGFSSPLAWSINGDGSTIMFGVNDPGLTGFEEDELSNLYVARIGGGFERPSPPVHCVEDSCQGPLAPPPPAARTASSGFSGRGNVAPKARKRRPCARKRGTAKRRCVRKQKQSKKRERRSRARANHNAGRAK